MQRSHSPGLYSGIPSLSCSLSHLPSSQCTYTYMPLLRYQQQATDSRTAGPPRCLTGQGHLAVPAHAQFLGPIASRSLMCLLVRTQLLASAQTAEGDVRLGRLPNVHPTHSWKGIQARQRQREHERASSSHQRRAHPRSDLHVADAGLRTEHGGFRPRG